jgi:hypothetical protein
MTTLSSSNLTINNIHQATGGSSGSQVSLNDDEVRVLADKETSGEAISFDNLRGKIGIPKTNSGPACNDSFINVKTYYFWNSLGTSAIGNTIPSSGPWSGVPYLESFAGVDAGQTISGKNTVDSPASLRVWFSSTAFHEGWTTLTHSTVTGSVKRTGSFTFSGMTFPAFGNPTDNGTYVIYTTQLTTYNTSNNYSSSGIPDSTASSFPSYNCTLS